MKRTRAALPALLGVAVVAALGLLWWNTPAADAEALAASIRNAGAVGPLILLALLVLQCVVAPIPSEPMMMAAGFVYGPEVGALISWAGVMLGALACFALARRYGRRLAERFVRPAHLDALDAYVSRRGLRSTFALVLGVRILAFGSFDVVSYGCGLTRFPWPWFAAATALGAVPKALAFSYAGATFAEPPTWLGVAILAGTFGFIVGLPWILRHRRQSA